MIPIARPALGDAEAAAAAAAIRSGWVGQGQAVAAFEAAFARMVEAPAARAVSNGTSALVLALQTLGIGPGDEVITVSHSFIASVHCIRLVGATPVLIDIDPATFNMTPAGVAAALTPRTRAILCVHQMGMPCDLEALRDLAETNGVILVEDAACAIGAAVRIGDVWRPVGAPAGRVACFSFHPRKVLTTGEGGMIAFADPEDAVLCRPLSQHGLEVRDGRAAFRGVAGNYRMTDIQAVVGLAQLKRLPDLVAERRRQAGRYRDLLAALPLRLPEEPAYARSNWQSFCVRLPNDADRDAVMAGMRARGVDTRAGVMCAHREPSCADLERRFPLTHSEAAQDRCVSLPLFPGLADVDLETVANALQAALSG